jgi:hypothetical protein
VPDRRSREVDSYDRLARDGLVARRRGYGRALARGDAHYYTGADGSLVAAAQIIQEGTKLQIQTEQWQDEAWSFYDTDGEYQYGVGWLGAALSRCRLTAARVMPGGDEPEPITEGPVAALMSDFGDGPSGQAQILNKATVQLSVPGEYYLTAVDEDDGYGSTVRTWRVCSSDEIRAKGSGKNRIFEVLVDRDTWVELPTNSIVVHSWNPHPRLSWTAVSPSKSALGALREVDLYNRAIIAKLTSRVAMNGLLLVPAEVNFQTRAELQAGDDPLIAELIRVASHSIANPGSPSAALPLPIKVPAAFIDKMIHLNFADGVDEKIIDAREKALTRVARALNIPEEIISGMGDSNHWTAWQLEESAVRIHIAPIAEAICHGLTVGYLQPALRAQQFKPAPGERYIVWYDTSELTSHPDRSAQATQVYDRLELSGEALRRESGFDEGDAPEPSELATMMLKKLLANPQLAQWAYQTIAGPSAPGGQAQPPAGAAPAGTNGSAPASQANVPAVAGSPSSAAPSGPPSTQNNPPPPPGSN